MRKSGWFAAAAAAVALVMAGCSEAPPPPKKEEVKKEEPKSNEPIAAQAAFWELYKPARQWAPDILVLTVKSGEIPNIKNEGGKAGAWIVTFVSPSKKEARTFTYAVADDGKDLKKGINVSDKLVWNGPTQASKAFVITEWQVNSDAAFKTAQEKAAKWLEENPKEKPTFLLGATSRWPGPVWYILWGTTKKGFATYVNATTGVFLTQ
jgi:hypothetical protein